ncbi:DUF4148 domain-containing protein [Caballeronia sp. dw_19]|jgi:hypothetical protein|uniref:DUF4148 domain-containing protein n=1 Tax=unclassified Caballeronia TaxID=2646786 RepID=UPI001BD693EA|nr:DUF4148 domain-containing protein [Caballeronia sp. dw_19]
MKKFLISALVISSALAAPAFAFAQSNIPVTRAQVEAELVQLERAGYNPGGEDVNYPQDIQAAEQRVAEQQGIASSSYGSADNGTSASGTRVQVAPDDATQSTYFGH